MWRLLLILFTIAFAPFAHAENNPLKTPNVSANALFQYQNSNEDTQTYRNGLDIQEAEVAFYSDVDPYSRLTVLLTVHPEYTTDTNNPAPNHKQEWKVEPEELFADSNEVPNFTFKAGKFYGAFGKHNMLHTHAYPFFDAPLANTTFLSTNGLNDPGVSAAYLLPINKWYSEFTLQYFRGEGNDTNTEFNSQSSDDGVILGHYKNLFDVSDDLTLEAGASAATGSNAVNRTTTLYGLDATFKWRPVSGGLYHSWIAALEYIGRTVGQPGSDDERGDGLTLWGQYQFAERWAALARYEDVEVHNAANGNGMNGAGITDGATQKYSAAVIFTATEFSSYRFEFDETHGPLTPKPNLGNEHKFVVQANFTIGSHPAHAY